MVVGQNGLGGRWVGEGNELGEGDGLGRENS